VGAIRPRMLRLGNSNNYECLSDEEDWYIKGNGTK